jgi:hypothetical protein
VDGDHQIEMTLNTTGLGINTLPSRNLDVSGNGSFSTQLSVGGSTGAANLNLQGTVSHVAQIVNSDTTLGSSSYILADSSSDNLILTLPSASSVSGTSFFIKKTSPLNQVWITAIENIENYNTHVLLSRQNINLPFAQLTSDGSQWYLLNKSSDAETVVAADNLEGWWKLEDISGTSATDTSLNKNHGTLNGSFTFEDNIISDQRDRALVLDGSDDGIVITQAPAINAGNNISFCIWLKGGVQGTNYRRIFSKSTGTAGFELQVQTAGPNVGLRIDTSAAANQVKTINTVLDDEWHHYAFTLSNGLVKIYLDGQVALNTAYNHGNGFSNTTDLKIGYGGAYFQGQIDEFRFYSRVLSAEEIDAIYQQTR